MLNFYQKIKFLESYLSNIGTSYTDGFKTDILFFFDDFNISNPRFNFLHNFKTESEISEWVDSLISQIVLKFDNEHEQLSDFIFEYII